MNLLFNEPQNYAWVLNYGRRLIEAESKDTEKNHTEHQINTRIYNNAFCGLLRTGYLFDVISINNQIFISLTIDDIPFQCPSSTVSNILRQEYDTIVRPKVEEYNRRGQSESEESEYVVSETNPISELVKKDEKTQSAVQLEETSLAVKLTPTKQIEIMRELIGNKKPNIDEKSEVKEPKTDSVYTLSKVNALHTIHEGSDNEMTEVLSKDFLTQMKMPVLDDIIFAPVKCGKVIEIDEVETAPVKDEKTESREEDVKETEILEPAMNEKMTGGQEMPNEENTDEKYGSIEELKASTSSDETKKAVVQSSEESSQTVPADSDDVTVPKAKNTAPEVAFHNLLETMSEENLNFPRTESVPHDSATKVPTPVFVEETLVDGPDHRIVESSSTTQKRVFQPKAQRFAPKSSSIETNPKSNVESSVIQPAPKEKKGFLSTIFGGGEKKKDDEKNLHNPILKEDTQTVVQAEDKVEITEDNAVAVQDNVIVKPDTSYIAPVERENLPAIEAQPISLPEEKTASYNHDGGMIFTHVHQVILKKQFGNSSVGPYRFIFWPLRIVEMQSKRTWADFLVHVTDQNGNEMLLCTDGVYKELIVKVDGKEFNVYATWTNGVFESHISPYGKTASIFTIEDEVFKEEPEDAARDSFLDQFRLERKGQPMHFVVPFKNNNRGELNIPIVGCVELGGKRYPLERREENTLRYRYHGSDKIIRGHWEKGLFKFTVEDANRFVWEEEHDE